jgi:hypothetical protein
VRFAAGVFVAGGLLGVFVGAAIGGAFAAPVIGISCILGGVLMGVALSALAQMAE